MSCEEYVVNKLTEFEKIVEEQKEIIADITESNMTLKTAINQLKGMFDVKHDTLNGKTRISLSVYEEYDKKEFELLMKIFNFDKGVE